ncbi:hypothetical protein FRC10_001266 [Ceratobasidium sp. 414]|nr:hypothetical protein FRC10_001266 [Ceratobasidium sp. 414]
MAFAHPEDMGLSSATRADCEAGCGCDNEWTPSGTVPGSFPQMQVRADELEVPERPSWNPEPQTRPGRGGDSAGTHNATAADVKMPTGDGVLMGQCTDGRAVPEKPGWNSKPQTCLGCPRSGGDGAGTLEATAAKPESGDNPLARYHADELEDPNTDPFEGEQDIMCSTCVATPMPAACSGVDRSIQPLPCEPGPTRGAITLDANATWDIAGTDPGGSEVEWV